MNEKSTELGLSSLDLRTATRDQKIAAYYLQGFKQEDIGKEVGLSQKQISNILRKDYIREIIENAITAMALYVPKVGLGLIELATQNDDKELKRRSTMDFFKVIGITAAQTPIAIQNLYIDARRQTLSADMVQLLGQGLCVTDSNETLDVEDYEIQDNDE